MEAIVTIAIVTTVTALAVAFKLTRGATYSIFR